MLFMSPKVNIIVKANGATQYFGDICNKYDPLFTTHLDSDWKLSVTICPTKLLLTASL
jgi:hypothetical protein